MSTLPPGPQNIEQMPQSNTNYGLTPEEIALVEGTAPATVDNDEEAGA